MWRIQFFTCLAQCFFFKMRQKDDKTGLLLSLRKIFLYMWTLNGSGLFEKFDPDPGNVLKSWIRIREMLWKVGSCSGKCFEKFDPDPGNVFKSWIRIREMFWKVGSGSGKCFEKLDPYPGNVLKSCIAKYVFFFKQHWVHFIPFINFDNLTRVHNENTCVDVHPWKR